MVKHKDVVVKFRGGGSIVTLPPVFSHDPARIYVACKNLVISYNTKTAIGLLEYSGLTRNIVGFGCTHIQDKEVVVACSMNGVIQIWEADKGFHITRFKLNLDVCFFKLLNVDSPVPQAIVGIRDAKSQIYKFAVVNLKTGELQMQKLVLTTRKKIFVDASGAGNYYVVLQGAKLFFHRFSNPQVYKYKIKQRSFTCVACHPEFECVLTGDNLGRVILWHSLHSNPTQAVFHWHTLPVQTVAFSTFGSCFYSGGSECVLVKWQMDDNVFKEFLPRLPSNIHQIAVANDGSLIAIGTEDNGIQIVDSRFAYVNVIQHLVIGINFSVGIIYDPKSKAVILNSIAGHVQFYLPKNVSLLYNLDVVCQNKLTNERDTKIINTLVTKVATDNTGLWMATVERRDDPDFPESRLKFWFFNNKNQNFSLNTCVEEPHNGVVSDVVFQPTYDKENAMCATSGKDKKFKIWKLVHVSTVSYEGQSWQCSSVVFYRDLTPDPLAFAGDGSLLAVAFDSIVTTWLPNSCELKCSLKHSSCQDDLIHVSCGIGPQCHLLVTATTNSLNVWNLLSLSLTWTVAVDVSLIISDPLTSYKAVFTKYKKVFIFEPKSPNPVYSDGRCLRKVGDIVAATFIPCSSNSDIHLSWHQRSQICFIDSNQEMYSLERNAENVNADSVNDDDMSNSLFSYMLPKIKPGLTSTLNVTHLYKRNDKSSKINELLQAPAHTMAPLHLTCEEILHSMILENRKVELESVTKEEENVDDIKSKSKSKGFELVDESSLSKVNLKSTSWMAVF